MDEYKNLPHQLHHKLSPPPRFFTVPLLPAAYVLPYDQNQIVPQPHSPHQQPNYIVLVTDTSEIVGRRNVVKGDVNGGYVWTCIISKVGFMLPERWIDGLMD